MVNVLVLLYVDSSSKNYDLSGTHVPVSTRTCTTYREGGELDLATNLRAR